jgi:hypothetical protein
MKTLNRVELQEFMVGTLLGDGALRQKNCNQNATYREAHKLEQKDLLIWKKDLLEHNLDIEFLYQEYKNNHDKDCCSINSRVHKYFTGLYPEFYPKRIPFNLMRSFGYFGLSVLYMDDGYTDWKRNGNINYCELCLDDFGFENVSAFSELLKERFGLISKVVFCRKKYPRIRLYGDSGRLLLKNIDPFIKQFAPSLSYKTDNKVYLEFRKTLECPTSQREENVCYALAK